MGKEVEPRALRAGMGVRLGTLSCSWFPPCIVTGRVREVTYWYKVRSVIACDAAALGEIYKNEPANC